MTVTDLLFEPLQLGDIKLSHRVIMAPLTRYRAPNYIPGDLMKTYYSQRATEGGLLLTEATNISDTCGMQPSNPRIDTQEAIDGWKPVVDAVHEKGGFFFCQINHFGRSALSPYNKGEKPLCSSAIKLSGLPASYKETNYEFDVPKEMDKDDMEKVINDFAEAAYNAIYKAGFDGIEIHGANGYLIDEFLEDNINVRTDEFGGSIENRCKFPLMILDAVIAKVGSSKKIGFRISPWDNFQDANDSDPVKHFGYVCQELEKRNLAYVHIIEARSDSNGGRENDASKSSKLDDKMLESSVTQLTKFLPTTPVLSAGGWNSQNYIGSLEKHNLDGLVFGRYFISNPDLVFRLKNNLPLNHYDRNTFYTPLEEKGYIDYPFYSS